MNEQGVRRAVILAAGRGARMRQLDASSDASAEQHEMADRGFKALIPMRGRPFIDFVVSDLVDIGIERVCFVVAPGRHALGEYCEAFIGDVELELAVQTEALGTADAVLAAADFVADAPFLLLNSDNYYPAQALAHLAATPGLALLGLDARRALGRGDSNLDRGRLEQYAFLEVGPGDRLTRIREKPGASLWREVEQRLLVGVNAWRLDSSLFEACRSITPSRRGELELPSAVQHALDHSSLSFQVVPFDEPMLDLSRRADIVPVERLLHG